ncbi:MAG: hypothetical protein WD266_07760 [Balneolales bacterium]
MLRLEVAELPDLAAERLTCGEDPFFERVLTVALRLCLLTVAGRFTVVADRSTALRGVVPEVLLSRSDRIIEDSLLRDRAGLEPDPELLPRDWVAEPDEPELPRERVDVPEPELPLEPLERTVDPEDPRERTVEEPELPLSPRERVAVPEFPLPEPRD